MELDSKALALRTAELIYEKKGADIIILDMEEISIICDYFIIASGSSRMHNRAIATHIEETLKGEFKLTRKSVQGKNDGGWILLDFGNVIVHIFLDNLRAYYNLETLWKEARVIQPDFANYLPKAK